MHTDQEIKLSVALPLTFFWGDGVGAGGNHFLQSDFENQSSPLLLLTWGNRKHHLTHLQFPKCFLTASCICQNKHFKCPQDGLFVEKNPHHRTPYTELTEHVDSLQPRHTLLRAEKPRFFTRKATTTFSIAQLRHKNVRMDRKRDTRDSHNTISWLSHEFHVLHMMTSIRVKIKTEIQFLSQKWQHLPLSDPATKA